MKIGPENQQTRIKKNEIMIIGPEKQQARIIKKNEIIYFVDK